MTIVLVGDRSVTFFLDEDLSGLSVRPNIGPGRVSLEVFWPLDLSPDFLRQLS